MKFCRSIAYLVLVLCATIVNTADATLVAYFPFNTNTDDIAGGRTGTPFNGAATTGPAAPNIGGTASLSLLANDDRVVVDIAGIDALSGNYTVALWANKTGDGTFFGTRGPSEQSFDAKFSGSSTIHGDIGNGGGWITTAADATGLSLSNNTWYHVAYAVSTTGYTIYLDGVQVGSGSYAANTPLLFDSAHDIAIGAVNMNGGENFNGYIDEVRIFDTTLTAAEIALLVPEPSSAVLMLGLSAGLLRIRRRK